MEDSQIKRNGRPARALTSLVDPMRRELSRWTGRLPERLTADRWTKWAGSFGSRHIAFERVTGFTRMILARRGFVERILRERWLSSINLYPVVNLSLAQRLKRSPNFSAPRPEVANTGQRLVSMNARRQRAGEIDLKRNRQVLIPFTVKDRTESHPLNSDAPLSRVFLRLNSVELLSRGRLSISNPAALLDSTQRIIRSFRRVEERTLRSSTDAPLLVVKQIVPSTFSGNQDKWLDDGQRIRETKQSFSTMEVDELTNQVIRQIDQRATAWRERMGKT